MGGIRHALDAALDAAHLPADTPIEEQPPVERSLLEFALGLAGLKASDATQKVAGLPIQVKTLLRGIAPLALYGDGQAMARMEWVPLDDAVGIDDDDP